MFFLCLFFRGGEQEATPSSKKEKVPSAMAKKGGSRIKFPRGKNMKGEYRGRAKLQVQGQDRSDLRASFVNKKKNKTAKIDRSKPKGEIPNPVRSSQLRPTNREKRI
jgi:tRNA/tmRNA/rRNA uracil-C5-methylase (TrmA/RlmC/RlmD family)